MSIALILAGHGSHISPNTAGVVWGYVDALRKKGIADEITAAFWKEQPHFTDVLRSIKSDTVVIVPVFTASGYFSRDVIPAEMGLTGDVTELNGKTISYTKTIGEHPAIPDIVKKRVIDALENANLSKDNTSVAIIGHGTKRSETTRKTTQHQVKLIAEADIVTSVIDAYLDDEPDIPSIYERTSTENIIVVPFFLAQGSHTTQDVPDALGIEYGDYPADANGRNVYYTPPIGTDDVIVDLILQLAHETGISLKENAVKPVQHVPQKGVNAVIEYLNEGKPLYFGELVVSESDVKPLNSMSERRINTLAELRCHTRENPFRPLASSDDLPCDWYFPVQAVEQIPAIIETVYPGALADWSAHQEGTFEPQSLEVVLARQQGMFSNLAVDEATIQHHVSSVCGRCSKHPSWHERTPDGVIPCPSPCNFWLSALKEGIEHEG